MKRLTVVLLAVGGVVVLSLALSGAFRGGASAPPPEPPTVIALDAGHGGVDPGATAGDIYEKTITEKIVADLAARFAELPDVEPLLTRVGDETISNPDRVQRAEEAGAVLYLSVHTNASSHPHAHGVEAWVDKTRSLDDLSFVLADAVLDELVVATGARDRGIRSADLYLHRASMPAASIEVGFLSNPEERAKLLDPAYQERIVDALYAGLLRYLTPAEEVVEADLPTPAP
jgi:N-acetylmuramoyl-L-alanine amidase